jgi:membrane carboxypeptidase/penicillin-binding protein PbpC
MRRSRAWRRGLIALPLLVLGVLAYYAHEVVRARAETPRLFRDALAADGVVLSPEDLSQAQIGAFLAVQQDTHFFEHKGSNFLGGTRTTVTEGLAKHLYFPEGFRPGISTIRRTLIARFAIDPLVSKRDQLKLFINIVPVGCLEEGLVEGLAKGAEVFYGKRFEELTHDEYLSLLVFDRPCRLNPLANPEGNAQRVRQIKRLLAGECRPPGLFNRAPNCWTEDPGRDAGRQE